MSFYVRPGHVFRNPCLIALRRLPVVGLKSNACKYCNSCGFEVCAIIFFITFYDCCIPKGTSHIPVFLFLITLIMSYPLFWIEISCLYSAMVYNHTKLLMILMGLYEVLGKCGSASLACSDLVAGVLLCVWNSYCFHLLVLFSYNFT